jgi:hypothetical protein
MMADAAGRGGWLGIMRLAVAGCGWVTVTVGSLSGYQLGYLAISPNSDTVITGPDLGLPRTSKPSRLTASAPAVAYQRSPVRR